MYHQQSRTEVDIYLFICLFVYLFIYLFIQFIDFSAKDRANL